MSRVRDADVERSAVTLLEMLEDRKVDVSDDDKKALREIEIRGDVFCVDLPSCSLRIVYCLSPKYNNRDVKKLVNEQSKHAIIITRELPTSGSQILNPDRVAQSQTYEVFKLSFMCRNISRHALQPKFELMSEEEVEQLLKAHSTTLSRLPVIQNTDAMAMYLGLKPGNVVRITRKTPSGGTTIFYRHCHAHKIVAAPPVAPAPDPVDTSA